MTLATLTSSTRRAPARARILRSASLRKSFGLAALMALAFLASPPARADDGLSTHRWRGHDFDTWADGRLVDVQLLVDGEAAPLYFANGRSDRHYLQAFAGRNYSVVLRNNTGNRVAVLLAVDGLNAVSGDVTNLRSKEAMYVLGPWEEATIRGWRTSLSEIRRFVFVDERRSYAARTGQANSDMGWIRVLAFREQLPWWEQHERGRIKSHTKSYYRDGNPGPLPPVPQASPVPETDAPFSGKRESNEAAPKMDGAAPRAQAVAPEAQDNLARGESESRQSFPGTGWGDRREDRVRRVQFNPEPVATDHLTFRYEYASGLHALGIDPLQGSWRDRLASRDGNGRFARTPRW